MTKGSAGSPIITMVDMDVMDAIRDIAIDIRECY